MSNARVLPRRRCAACRVPSNRCPCKVCRSCTTTGGDPSSCRCGALVVEGDPGALADLPPPAADTRAAFATFRRLEPKIRRALDAESEAFFAHALGGDHAPPGERGEP